MVNMEDFRNADGRIDWNRWQEAQIAAGQACRRCRQYIPIYPSRAGGPALCYSCRRFDESHAAEYHDRRLRCPKCRHQWDASTEDCSGVLFSEGEHGVSCPSCEHDFQISTTVTYRFESPALERLEETGEPHEETGE